MHGNSHFHAEMIVVRMTSALHIFLHLAVFC